LVAALVAAQIDKEKALDSSFGEIAWLRQLPRDHRRRDARKSRPDIGRLAVCCDGNA
jgi:hypothetical protein